MLSNLFYHNNNFQLDYIPRLMWQGQIKGKKNWLVAPVPECEHICNKFQYYIQPGDVGKFNSTIS